MRSEIQPKFMVPSHADHRTYLITFASNLAACKGFEVGRLSGGPSVGDILFKPLAH